MLVFRILILVFLSMLFAPWQTIAAELRLKDYLNEKNLSPEQKYQILYDVHRKAISQNASVSYEGIDSLCLEIPKNARAIPIRNNQDFQGVVIRVLNNSQSQFLYDIRSKADSINIRKIDIDRGDFRSYPSLKDGKHLLVITDNELWVDQRSGHDYGHVRKDILYIENGRALNKVISRYNNKRSSPLCVYSDIGSPIELKNLTIIRDERSQCLTTCFFFQYRSDIIISNIKAITQGNPYSLVSDRAFAFYNCANILMEDVFIDGSYSLTHKSGYGILMNNVWKCKFVRLYGHGEWGIFGTNNINQAILQDCDINRFDIHCYGKDVSCYNCKFSNLYNQFSGVYGTILYDHCTFDSFTPYLNGGSYDAHVRVKVVLKDCVWWITKQRYAIVDDRKPYKNLNPRKELRKKYTPRVKIDNLTIYSRDNRITDYVIYKETHYPE